MDTQKIALITGVSKEKGLGFETARLLKEKGYTVMITASDYAKVARLASKLHVLARKLDVTLDHNIAAVAFAVQDRFGKLDVLVNNAGSPHDLGMDTLTTEMSIASDAFDTNVLGAWRMTNRFLPLLKRSDAGRIVNVSSSSGSFSDPEFGLSLHETYAPAYSITKLALNGLTVKLASALKDTNIKINSVCPGFVTTHPSTGEQRNRMLTEGARGVVWAATLPADGPTGGFFRDSRPIGW